MGPFELMDLVGIDVGFEVAKSFDAQSFGEPRWKPNPLQARMVAAGRLGRKAGRGWYEYGDDGPHRPEDPEPREPGGGDGKRVAVDGTGALARELRERAQAAGFDARAPGDFGGARSRSSSSTARVPAPTRWAGHGGRRRPDGGALRGSQPGAARDPGGVRLPPPAAARALPARRADAPAVVRRARVRGHRGVLPRLRLRRRSGSATAPGLVLGRIVCQLVNEAAFAVGEGVGSGADVDAGLKLGLNHPRGPVEWGNRIGLSHVLATIDGLFEELHDPRYRAAPLLRRAVATGRGLD